MWRKTPVPGLQSSINLREGDMVVTEILAGFVAGLKFDDLPRKVVEAAKMAYLDWLGSALAGSDKRPTLILDRVVREMGGSPEATVVTGSRKTSAAWAALVNGASSHVVELDDVHKSSILHAGAVAIPAALAVCEKNKKTGRDLIAAIVAGYEVGIRVGEAVTPSHYKIWHTTGTCGTFGAAAAAAKAAGLDKEGCWSALGSAGTQAAGLWEFIENGAMSKHLHPGKAAMNGVLSALLAGEGYTAARKMIEGRRGFCVATAREYHLNKITSGLGEKYKIMENCYKIHASCRHTHHVIDIILDLRKRYRIQSSMVEKIKIRTYSVALDIAGNISPDSVYAAKFSLPFCAALGLVSGGAGPEKFSEINLFHPEIRKLIRKTELVVDPTLEEMYPEKWPATVELTLADGQVISGQTEFPRGDPENPLSQEEIVEKFRSLAKPYLSPENVKKLTNRIFRLESVEDLRKVLFCLNG